MGLENDIDACFRSDREGKFDECLERAVRANLQTSLDSIYTNFSNRIIDDGGRVVEAVGLTIEDTAVRSISDTALLAQEVLDTFDVNISTAIDSVDLLIKDTSQFINTQAAETSQSVLETFTAVNTFIEGVALDTALAVEESTISAINNVDILTQEVILGIEDLLGVTTTDLDMLITGIQEDITEDVTDVTDLLSTVATESLLVVTETVESVVESTGGLVSELGKFIDLASDKFLPDFIKATGKILGSILFRSPERIKEDIRIEELAFIEPEDLLAKIVTDKIGIKELLFSSQVKVSFFGIIMAYIQLGASNVLIAVQAATIANAVKIESMLQTLWKGDPIRTLSFPESVSLHSRGFMSHTQAENEAATQGFNSERFDLAVAASKTPLSIEQNNDALHRGIINDVQYKSNLKRQVYNSEDIDRIRTLSDLRPPIQDLITMSVRDVFNPNVVSEFELLSGLPDEFVTEAKKSGLSKAWAEKYWGAHWRLPSANQGFEMFHRGIITESQLDLLITALDLSPFWRDKLKSMAFRPITRVDIRRMFKLGVMDESEVERRHLDLGYSPTDAKKMTSFVTSLIGDAELEDDIDPRDLTKNQIERLFLLGTLSKQDTLFSLEELGFSSTISLILVGLWETEQQVGDRERIIGLIISKAIREDLTVDKIEQLVTGLDLTIEERERMNREIVLRGAEFPNIPTKAELLKMLKGIIINKEDWINAMHQHGYNDVWIDRYQQLFGVKDA